MTETHTNLFIGNENDYEFIVLFYVGVKTTGIFCRPMCRAWKPKKQNVEFFIKAKDALDYSYRPCKICKPLEKPGHTPGYIREVLDELTNAVTIKFV
ncbi:hypothetical protein BH23BAC3_BH23BAC3_20890 [soil metagenome]